MKRVETPPASLTLTDTRFGEYKLRVTPSNQGEPYRRTLILSFERGGAGTGYVYENLGSVELDGDEERQLRDFLNARNPPRTP